MKIAITVVAYNRVDSLARLMHSLQQAYYDCQKVDLIVSVDKSNNPQIYEYVDSLIWEHGALYREYKPQNMGLRAHILSCGDYFEKYNQDALIILEDDIYVARDFLQYAVETVEKYHENPDIAGISLYAMSRCLHMDIPFTPLRGKCDVYFMQYAQSWGQIWMREQWRAFKEWYITNTDYDFSNAPLPYNVTKWAKTSWLKYHIAYCIENHKYFVYPYESLTTNFADAGTHYTQKTNKMQVKLLYGRKSGYCLPELTDECAIKYDGFEENEGLSAALGLSKQDVCIDLFGLKGNLRGNQRYWLTRKILDFKVLKSFDLALIPHDANVLENVAGELIFLYDTAVVEKRPQKNKKQRSEAFWNYYYNSPNVFKYNVPRIYCNQVVKRIGVLLRSKMKKLRKKR